MLEEAYEVIDALDSRDFDAFEDELGDLLFQVVFYSRLAEEEGRFGFDDVVERICDKLIRRHPHVFGDQRAKTPAEALASWTAVKEKELARPRGSHAEASLLDGIPAALPATLQAQELGLRAAQAGFDWKQSSEVLKKAREEIAELEAELAKSPADKKRVEEEIGDLLFTLANLARHVGTDAESCLRSANRKFTRRFQSLEREAARRGRGLRELGSEAMERLWESVKEGE